jgi:hypothetical protein
MNKKKIGLSLLGDSGSTEATVVPNLESFNTGSDAYITSVSDTSEFNVFGQTKIYDNFWETTFARHTINTASYINTPQSNDSTYSLQGNTEGWARMDQMALSVPITFRYNFEYSTFREDEYFPNVGTNGSNFVDDYLVGGAYFPWDFQSMFNNPAIVFCQEYLGHFKHAWFGCIDVFTRLRCLVGNNGQCIQTQLETEPIGLKYHMTNLRSGEVVDKAVGEWGVAQPLGIHVTEGYNQSYNIIGDNINANTHFGTSAAAVTRCNEVNLRTAILCQKSRNYQTSPHFYRMISNVGSCSNCDTRDCSFGPANETVTLSRWLYVTKKRALTLPLQAILPFFRGARFLPPDFRFKFEINMKTLGVKIMEKPTPIPHMGKKPTKNSETSYINRDPILANANVFVTGDPTGVELHYPYHILRQPVQAAISSMWLQKPFLYNYESAIANETVIQGYSTFINFQISVSSERPTALDVYLFPIVQSVHWDENFAQCYDTMEYLRAPYVGAGYRIIDTPHNHGDFDAYSGGAGAAGKDSLDSGPCMWTEAEITFSGRCSYRLKNTGLKYAKSLGVDSMQPNEFIIQMLEEQSFRSTSTELNATCSVEKGGNTNQYTSNSYLSNKLMRLIIQPGGWADRAVISSRQGATSIGVTITFSRPLSPKDKVVAIRLNPEQLVFDSDKNVTIVRWPAIKSNQGYLVTNISAPF